LRRWTETVRCLAQRRGGHSLLDPAVYQTLQSELIELCRQPDEQLARTAQAREKLRELVGPWVTLDSLVQARRRILDDLLDRAERLQRELAGRGARKTGARWRRLALPVAAVLPIVVLVAVRCDLCPQAAWLSERLRDLEWIVAPPWVLAEVNRLQHAGPAEMAVILGIAEAVVLAPLLWFSRSWS
jgi:hypothetical protein